MQCKIPEELNPKSDVTWNVLKCGARGG